MPEKGAMGTGQVMFLHGREGLRRSTNGGRSMGHALSGFCFAKPCRVIEASMIAQTKALEDENRRLKKMFAEMSMQNELLNCEGERHRFERT
jgi:hypothetical protein